MNVPCVIEIFLFLTYVITDCMMLIILPALPSLTPTSFEPICLIGMNKVNNLNLHCRD